MTSKLCRCIFQELPVNEGKNKGYVVKSTGSEQ